MSIDLKSLRERAERDHRHEQPMGVNPATILALLDRLDAAKRELSRYSMCAGHADQRMSESRAARKALGFGEDADDVSPRDLTEAIASREAQARAKALREVAAHLMNGTYSPGELARRCVNEARKLEPEAEEPSP
ncbi:hypothetical protein K4A83_11270 [Spirulina subsalsa FACHB-351]|uniref:Uncharacterized protein n=1 Tax=Spirulina subsalsa FACHB-351 TaxID=234711 RepID=A0ABT3L5R9_9CYAN|nr:hypothetical protein [Spirulina subsalsa]MCW6036838.1 hypothetical protein [Spirulina subsalsa FACHB-351]